MQYVRMVNFVSSVTKGSGTGPTENDLHGMMDAMVNHGEQIQSVQITGPIKIETISYFIATFLMEGKPENFDICLKRFNGIR